MLFSSFCWHREDVYLASINYMHAGEGKQWYVIPGDKAKAFKSVMEKSMKLRMKEVPDLEHNITTMITPDTLKKNGVPVFKALQEAGQFIVTFPEAIHAGFSYGFNCCEAANFATSDWIPHGSQSVLDYRLQRKREVFSFDRLLFTLTYHLPTLPLESCRMLLKELEVLQADEAHFRKLLYGTGVADVTKVSLLPQEGRMSREIPEELANYDDQRVCVSCLHTCFLSAVCCNCRCVKCCGSTSRWCHLTELTALVLALFSYFSEQAVSCLRCCDSLCKCPRKNKFLLEWHSNNEIEDVVAMTRAHIRKSEGTSP
jgi:histone demethylase JARID1